MHKQRFDIAQDIKRDLEKRAKESKIVRINVEVPEALRNAFKTATTQRGETVKSALIRYMENYIQG